MKGESNTASGAPKGRPQHALFPAGMPIDRNIVRLFVATAIAYLQLAAAIYGAPLRMASVAACAVYVIWAVFGLFSPRFGSVTFRMPAWTTAVIEMVLCCAIVATGGPILVSLLGMAVALFMPSGFLRHISYAGVMKALLIAGSVSGALIIGNRLFPPLIQTSEHPLDLAFAALSFLLFAAILGADRPSDEGRDGDNAGWDDELAHHVALASKSPVERLIELIAEVADRDLVMAFVGSEAQPTCRAIPRDGGETPVPDVATASVLLAAAGDGRPFLFDTKSGQALCSSHKCQVGLRAIPELAAAWNSGFAPGRGAAIPIALAGVRGWLYIVTGKDLSHRSFLELRKVAADVGGITTRFERFDSWRERTLAEARLLASRDMHDSVLQTLGGLRMQLGSMIKRSETEPSGQDSQIRSLDAIVAAEQQSLRAILKRSKDEAQTAAELFYYLEMRAHSLARQWNVRCTVEIPEEALPVSEETAIECEFMLREAISNAAQHADAEHIRIVLGLNDDNLLITLSTERGPARGRREHPGAMPTQSASLGQRVTKLGGSIYLEPTNMGGILSIQIPLERK